MRDLFSDRLDKYAEHTWDVASVLASEFNHGLRVIFKTGSILNAPLWTLLDYRDIGEQRDLEVSVTSEPQGYTFEIGDNLITDISAEIQEFPVNPFDVPSAGHTVYTRID